LEQQHIACAAAPAPATRLRAGMLRSALVRGVRSRLCGGAHLTRQRAVPRDLARRGFATPGDFNLLEDEAGAARVDGCECTHACARHRHCTAVFAWRLRRCAAALRQQRGLCELRCGGWPRVVSPAAICAHVVRLLRVAAPHALAGVQVGRERLPGERRAVPGGGADLLQPHAVLAPRLAGASDARLVRTSRRTRTSASLALTARLCCHFHALPRLSPLLLFKPRPDMLLLGCGQRMARPPPELSKVRACAWHLLCCRLCLPRCVCVCVG
jgi:hypothetical protein